MKFYCAYIKTLVLFIVLLIGNQAIANTFIVTNTADSGNGSLRWAIQNCNIYPGSHTILFNIPESDGNYNEAQGVWRIDLTSNLPMLNHSNVLIDGHSQATYSGDKNPYGPEIVLDGGNNDWADYGINIYNASGITIQGLIIGGFVVGIQMTGENAFNNTISGNYIGCNYNATESNGNTHGIYILSGPHNNIIGGNTPVARNILSGNNHTGMRVVNASYNTIQGNYVGLNRTGTAALHNYDGISIEGISQYNLIGGYTPEERNYVSGNMNYGIPAFGIGCYYNIIAGNYVGTDITGNNAIPNTYGVLFDDGACYNTLGGITEGAGNLLSGNSGYGVFIYNFGTMKDTVRGNLIGTNAEGTAAVPNANGIVIDGPSYQHTIDNNVISGNLQMGIDIHIAGSDSNIVINNKIGTDISGMNPLGNLIDGIRIAEGPDNNIIGRPGQGNIIAYNGGNGVTIITAAEQGNTISVNSIYANECLGIDLFPEGITANDEGDSDSGPNSNMNFPVITQISISTNVQLWGHVDSPGADEITVEFFKSDYYPSGTGQGREYIGSCSTDASGNFSYSIAGGLSGAIYICTTATDGSGNTSEFSANKLCVQTGIDQHVEVTEPVSIYPNPAATSFRFNNFEIGRRFLIVNNSGQVMGSGIWKGDNIPVSYLLPGSYYVLPTDVAAHVILLIIMR